MARLARGALVSVALGLLACNGLTERRLRGTWEAEALPKRRLELAADGTYARRFTGNKLGLVSEVVGPERGQWRVEGGTLVLVRREAQRESIDRLEVRDLSPDHVVLAGEKWRRQSQPTPSASPSP